jgi:DeoR family transcriptional regulator of aga operon
VEAHTNRALIERAQRSIVVADSSKIGRSAFAQICALDLVDELITDAAADREGTEALREAGLDVTVV